MGLYKPFPAIYAGDHAQGVEIHYFDLAGLLAVFYEMRAASLRGSPRQAKSLSQNLLKLQQEAGQYAVPNDFGARLSQAGAVNLNASTSHDATQYTASLPSNKLELWFALEADRFQVIL